MTAKPYCSVDFCYHATSVWLKCSNKSKPIPLCGFHYNLLKFLGTELFFERFRLALPPRARAVLRECTKRSKIVVTRGGKNEL